MWVKASGRSALIIAAGLFVCFASPAPVTAATSSDRAAASKPENATPSKTVRKSARQWKRYARRSAKAASKPTAIKKTVDKDVADATTDSTLAVPAVVANANAMQLASADPAPDSASAMTAKANTMLQTVAERPVEPQGTPDASVVASDQLNDLDRALQQPAPPVQTVAVAPAQPVVRAAPIMASSIESSTWDQTSLIGKIFIAFGALLTMASAARMFMA